MVTPDTVVQLGPFSFQAFEVPERLPFGGDQSLAIHQLLGGVRVIDALGDNNDPIEWSGIFLGGDAEDRARELVALRKAGQPLQLTWSQQSYTVVIRRFDPVFERFYQIPYSITCEVVEDLGNAPSTTESSGVDDQMSEDAAQASDLSDQIGDTDLSGYVGDLGTAMDAVPNFAVATTAQIASCAAPLSLAQGRLSDLIDATDDAIGSGMAFGGVVTGSEPGDAASTLSYQVASMQAVPAMYQLQSVLGRIGANLSAIGISGTPMSVAGGDLYHIAAQVYGDPSEWTTIARANGLTDPVLYGAGTIIIPPSPDGNDGVLSP